MSLNRIRLALVLAATLVGAILLCRPADAATARYVDVYAYLQTDAQFEAWHRVTQGLRRDFDAICGDTFCEGDYSNIASLRYRCSIEQASGRVGQCLWVLAGSMEEVDPATGRIHVTAKVWRCRSPLGRLARFEELLHALDVGEPIRAPLPGSGRSLYDGLGECL